VWATAVPNEAYTALPLPSSPEGKGGSASPASPGPAPRAGGRHGLGALGWLLDPPQSQSPSPQSQGLLSLGSPATGAPRPIHSVPGEP
jgi:hypothetical protein